MFITVLGKIIGERPAGPRRRNPAANSSLERKSPCSVPTTMPSPGAARRCPRPRTASRQAATARRQMRERRRAASRSTRDGERSRRPPRRRAGSARRRRRRRGAGRWPSGRGRARPPARPAPPAVGALTVPIPVTTTRRRHLVGAVLPTRSCHRRSRKIRLTFWPPKPKEFDSAASTSAGRADPGHAVEGDLGIHSLEVGGGRHEAVLEGQDRGGRLQAARRGHGVARRATSTSSPARRPRRTRARSARASMRSFWGVPVPCALT